MPTTDRDDPAMDRLLSHALRGTDASGPACLDAETLGAWAEQALPSAAARRVEAHVSSCARCQAMAAAFVRAEPADRDVAVSFWERWRLHWVGPVAAALAVVTIYVATRQPAPTLESVESRVEPASAQPPPSAAPPREPAAPTVAEVAPVQERRPDETAQKTTPETVGEPAAETSTGAVADRSFAPLAAPPPPAPVAAAPVPPSPATPAPVPPPPALARTERDQARQAQANEVAAPVAASVAEPATAPAQAAAPPRLAEGRAALALPAPGRLDVRTGDGRARWRLAVNGGVEYSSDAGATWRATSLVEARSVRAGSSPSPQVCWLVGDGGGVWLATDGVTFTRLPFPEVTVLSGVIATSARAATVTTANGRTFRTTDAGATWNPVPRPS